MSFPQEQIDALKALGTEVRIFVEGGITYFWILNLCLPDGCSPSQTDALLCPSARDNYPTRLFFSQRITSRVGLNWNANGVRIGEKVWHAFSWKDVSASLGLVQILTAHLGALR